MNAARRLFAMLMLALVFAVRAAAVEYESRLGVQFAEPEGEKLKLNAFLPKGMKEPAPAMVEIHGGWWHGGGPSAKLDDVQGGAYFRQRKLAVFSISYRLGAKGGFPECIRDCRNAVRFIRRNAAKFGIDPGRIAVTGGSAGGHLSLMVAMVNERFDDGGPAPGLENVSAKVCGAFSYIPPTDLIRLWRQGPDDVVMRNGKPTFRSADESIPHDSRPRLRVLFHGAAPDTEINRDRYRRMSPIGSVRPDVPPLLICDGENDPIVRGLQGRILWEKLNGIGAKGVTYWMTPHGGHAFPAGDGFDKILNDFLDRTYGPANP